ncbi:MAG: hypothetical protein ACD_8C00056G0020 [uncultured bacterium]|nr:MAG: hypothetical protein ACD_8C00056G0020 [uncultured bacterium]
MKTKLKKITYWTGVSIVGIIVGISLQFARAWTEPGSAPPAGNVGAPINISTNPQIKTGSIGVSSGLIYAGALHSPNAIGDVKGTRLCIGNDCANSWANAVSKAGSISTCTNATTSKLYWNGTQLVCGTDQSGSGGDNLGSHSATQTLNMNSYGITSSGSIYTSSTIRAGSGSPVSAGDIAGTRLCIGSSCANSWASAVTSGGGITSESDPQVGTLTNGNWCTTNGSSVNCTSPAPAVPNLGCITVGYLHSDAGCGAGITAVPTAYSSSPVAFGVNNCNANAGTGFTNLKFGLFTDNGGAHSCEWYCCKGI